MPWDEPDDVPALREYAESLGLGFDAVNSNTFQDNPSTTGDGAVTYKFGSMAAADAGAREAAVEHNLHVIDLGEQLGSSALSIWIGDGIEPSGPGELPASSSTGSLSACAGSTTRFPMAGCSSPSTSPTSPRSTRPSSTTGARPCCSRRQPAIGPGASSISATISRTPNIEQVVSRLAMTGRLGGFHFNDSKYGDDDLTVGSIRPYELFLIDARAAGARRRVDAPLAYMIDQSNNLKDPDRRSRPGHRRDPAHACARALRRPLGARGGAGEDDPARWLPRSSRPRTAPMSGRSLRKLAGGTARRSIPSRPTGAAGYREAVIGARGSGHVATGL